MNSILVSVRQSGFRLWGWVAVFALLVWGRAAMANPGPAGPACPSAGEIRAELAVRLEQGRQLRTRLQDFLAGKLVGGVPLSALFTIVPNDPDAVAKRVKELEKALGAESGARVSADPFLICALTIDALREQAREILSLQRDADALRLQFLTLPADKRSAILKPQIEAGAQAETIKQLREEHDTALEEQKQAVKSLARFEQQALVSGGGTAGDLVAARAELERLRSELADLQLRWVSSLEREAAYYRETAARLVQIARLVVQPEETDALLRDYESSVLIWRELVDKTRKVVSARYERALPPIPNYPEALLRRLGNTPEATEYAAAYADARGLRQSLLDKIGTRLEESSQLHYRVLLQSGEIRSQLLNQLLDRGVYTPLTISRDLFQDIRRELNVVPYRWMATFYLRWLEVRRRLNQGWEGLAETATNAAFLLGLFLVPWIIWVGSQHLHTRLSRLRIDLVRRSRAHPKARNLALIIQKLLPYSTWLVMLVAVQLTEFVLPMTVFSELTLLLPYVRYYVYYRLFRQLMQCDFIWVNQQIRMAKLFGLRAQVDMAARVLGLSALVIFSFLSIIEGLIRRGLVFHLASRAMLYLGLLIIIAFAYQWRGVIGAGLGKLLPGILGQKVADLCAGRWGLLLAIPALLLLIVLLGIRLLGDWGSHFEWTKRIAAEVFRHQLESAIEVSAALQMTPCPEEYREAFALCGSAPMGQLVMPPTATLNEIRAVINAWAQGSSPLRSLALVGHKGSGKTCLLNYLGQNAPVTRTVRAAVPAKLIRRAQVLDFFRQAVELPAEDGALEEWLTDAERPKTLVLLDDAHNLFLATLGGFEGFETVLEFITRPLPNLFWGLAFNHHAWNYLNSVNDRHQYFGAVVRLAPWSEQAIQEMILTTHGRTEFHHSYDDIIQAAGSPADVEHISYIENRFFSLLRQQSRGNPRLAVHLWLSALRRIGDDALRVGLPEEPNTAPLSELSEDALFVFAAITRHENLTVPQAMAVTQLPEGVVRHILDSGVRDKLLDSQDGGVYRAAVLYQFPLISYLQAKHCLYE